jgi:hypothetical protein
MNVNFNNLRKQAIYAYDRLTDKLNAAILKERQLALFTDSKGEEVRTWGNILIDAEDIQKDMDSLRMMIGSIAMVYEPDSKDFADVYAEVFPDEDSKMKCFNDQDEEGS